MSGWKLSQTWLAEAHSMRGKQNRPTWPCAGTEHWQRCGNLHRPCLLKATSFSNPGERCPGSGILESLTNPPQARSMEPGAVPPPQRPPLQVLRTQGSCSQAEARLSVYVPLGPRVGGGWLSAKEKAVGKACSSSLWLGRKGSGHHILVQNSREAQTEMGTVLPSS